MKKIYVLELFLLAAMVPIYGTTVINNSEDTWMLFSCDNVEVRQEVDEELFDFEVENFCVFGRTTSSSESYLYRFQGLTSNDKIVFTADKTIEVTTDGITEAIIITVKTKEKINEWMPIQNQDLWHAVIAKRSSVEEGGQPVDHGNDQSLAGAHDNNTCCHCCSCTIL